jgi:ATP-dependent protease ClpP protease subunit
MTTSYISFLADINPITSAALIAAIFEEIRKGATEVYLLLSTPGGTVDHGVAVYNVLKGLPVPFTTHNVGSVNSIGNVVLLAGKKRRAAPGTTFMFHGVGFDITGPQRFEEKTLLERLDAIRADQAKIGAIILERTKITKEEVEKLFLEASTKDTGFALDKGIIDEIVDVNLPAGAPLIQLVFQR